MSFRRVFSVVAAASVLLCAASVQAVTFNFASIADVNGEGSIGGVNGVYDNPVTIAQGFPINGVSITANSTYSAYLDAGNAGLGVCKIVDINGQCTPGSDDNLTSGETVTFALSSGGTFDFSMIAFRDGSHNLLDDAGELARTLLVSVDGSSFEETTFGEELSTVYAGITSLSYGYGGSNADQYYLAAADISPGTVTDEVPEPGTLAVFCFGLLGIGYVRRHRQQRLALKQSAAQATA
jgi:hypothetical protein